MGEVEVPADALWRAQTQRAVENFPISGRPLRAALVHALARIKAAAARANADLGVVTAEQARRHRQRRPPRSSAGEHDDQFPIDVFQTGSGTSTNMNVNEVISSLDRRAPVSSATPTTSSTPASPPTTPSRAPIHVAAVLAARARWTTRMALLARRADRARPRSSPTR